MSEVLEFPTATKRCMAPDLTDLESQIVNIRLMAWTVEGAYLDAFPPMNENATVEEHRSRSTAFMLMRQLCEMTDRLERQYYGGKLSDEA